MVAAIELAAANPTGVTLKQAIAIAAARSPVLQIADDQSALSAVNVDLARVPQRPSVAANLAYTHGARTLANPSSVIGILSLSQLIFDGSHTLSQIEAAQNSASASAATLLRSAQQLAFNVSQAYYGALEARDAVALTKDIVAQDKRQEDLIRAQIVAGTASRLDLDTAHLPTQQALLQFAKLQGLSVAAEAAFDNVMGLPADSGVEPASNRQLLSNASLIPGEPLNYELALQKALAARPDYISSQRAAVAASYNLRAARSTSAPQFGLAATAGSASFPGFDVGIVSENSIQAAITLPIYNQGTTNALSAQASIQLDQAQATEREVELSVELDVRASLALLQSGTDALNQAEAELAGARQVLSDTQLQYRAGVTNLLFLLNAQSGLTTAENDRLQALYTLREDEQSYLFALGDAAFNE